MALPPSPGDAPTTPVPVDKDRKAAADFMDKVGSWIVQSEPKPMDPDAQTAVQLAAEADAAKVPVFLASVMRRKILFVIKMWEGLERAFDKIMDDVDGLDAEGAGVLFDRLCREEERHMKSILALKGVIEGIDWQMIEGLVSGRRVEKASRRLPPEEREKLRRVFKQALAIPGDEAEDDPEIDGGSLTDEEPTIDAEFTVIGDIEDE